MAGKPLDNYKNTNKISSRIQILKEGNENKAEIIPTRFIEDKQLEVFKKRLEYLRLEQEINKNES